MNYRGPRAWPTFRPRRKLDAERNPELNEFKLRNVARLGVPLLAWKGLNS